jgi:hypothetical protein
MRRFTNIKGSCKHTGSFPTFRTRTRKYSSDSGRTFNNDSSKQNKGNPYGTGEQFQPASAAASSYQTYDQEQQEEFWKNRKESGKNYIRMKRQEFQKKEQGNKNYNGQRIEHEEQEKNNNCNNNNNNNNNHPNNRKRHSHLEEEEIFEILHHIISHMYKTIKELKGNNHRKIGTMHS